MVGNFLKLCVYEVLKERPLSFRYPIVELLTGLATSILCLKFGATGKFIMSVLLIYLLLFLAQADWFYGVVHSGVAYVGTVLGLLSSLFFGDPVGSFLGMSGGVGLSWLVGEGYYHLKRRIGLGEGDYDVFAMVGAFIGGLSGWQEVVAVFFLTFLLALPYGVLWMRVKGNRTFPLVPAITLVSFLCLVFSC